jgi:GDPmannose 4,6-dehydratase
MSQPTAIIIGITGQDGGYLAKSLLEKGYRVIGAIRRSSILTLPRLVELGVVNDVELETLDIQELPNIIRLIETTGASEIYNLGGQSSVQASFQQPIYTVETAGLGTLRLLEAINLVGKGVRLYQASSSEIFGRNDAAVDSRLVDESTLMRPRSPYGAAKLFGHWVVVNYREAHDLFAVSGILFNHESPLRGLEFVTRKITATLAQQATGNQQVLRLGNLDSRRDWSYAGDFVEAMWKMLQVDEADDYVVASGATHSVRDWVEIASQHLGFEMAWEGEGVDEVGFDKKTGRQLVNIDKAFFRPSEPEPMLGDPSKASEKLNWKPEVNFAELVEMMAKADYDRAKAGGDWF